MFRAEATWGEHIGSKTSALGGDKYVLTQEIKRDVTRDDMRGCDGATENGRMPTIS